MIKIWFGANWNTYLRLDLISAAGFTVVTNSVLLVGSDDIAVISARRASTTCVEVSALLVLRLVTEATLKKNIKGNSKNVLVASLINETDIVGVFPNTQIISTVAASSASAINNFLDAQICRGESSSTHDVDTISKSRGRAVCPAASAILRDVLVSDGAQKILSVHIPPVPRS